MSRKKIIVLCLCGAVLIAVLVGRGHKAPRGGSGVVTKAQSSQALARASAGRATPGAALDIIEQEIQATQGFLEGQTERKLLIAILDAGTDFLIKSSLPRTSSLTPNKQRVKSDRTTLALERAMVASNKLYVAVSANDRAKTSVLLVELQRALVDLRTAVKKN